MSFWNVALVYGTDGVRLRLCVFDGTGALMPRAAREVQLCSVSAYLVACCGQIVYDRRESFLTEVTQYRWNFETAVVFAGWIRGIPT